MAELDDHAQTPKELGETIKKAIDHEQPLTPPIEPTDADFHGAEPDDV